jgi:enoyl-[acyl-carrier protein] reductase II
MLALGADGVAMGSRLATSVESPLAEPVKHLIVSKTESDTIYGKNFDGLGARIMLTEAATEAMRKPLNPVVAAYKAFGAAKLIKMPMWKVIPGLLSQWKQMYQLSLFGAATVKLMKATVDGDTKEGIQFIGQSQGLINDVATVEVIIQRCVADAIAIHYGRMATMIADGKKDSV